MDMTKKPRLTGSESRLRAPEPRADGGVLPVHPARPWIVVSPAITTPTGAGTRHDVPVDELEHQAPRLVAVLRVLCERPIEERVWGSLEDVRGDFGARRAEPLSEREGIGDGRRPVSSGDQHEHGRHAPGGGDG